MSPNELRVESASTLAQLEALERDWRWLYDRTDVAPYCGFEWFRDALTLTPEPRNVGFCVCLLHGDAGPVAVVPLQIVRGLFATHVTFLADGQAAADTCLITPAARGLRPVQRACQWVGDHHCAWDYCLFRKVMAGSLVHEELAALGQAADSADRVETRSIGANVRIELPESWAAYAAGLSSAHRQNIARRSRGLAKLGEVRFERHGLTPGASGAALQRAMEDALAICRRSWQGSSEHGRAICDDDQEAFFRGVCRTEAAMGQLDLSLLYLDEKPVSFIWGMARRQLGSIATLAFDPAYESVSPGLVHMARYLEDSIDRGFHAIDFGHEFSDYKRRWSKSGEELFEVTYYSRPRLSRLKRRLQGRWHGSIRPSLQRWRRGSATGEKSAAAVTSLPPAADHQPRA